MMIEPVDMLQDMEGRICMVTGATSGIGRATASALAALRAQVVVVGREEKKAEDTVRWLRSETGRDTIHYLVADFSDLQQVRELASSYMNQYPHLDVLINNAGAFFNTRRKTGYGVELTFLVNHLAPFLLTNLLMASIEESSSGRILNVSSDAHQYGALDFEDLEFKRGYFGMKAYARSKLANILFTYELARRQTGGNFSVNALNPGHVATDIWRTDFSVLGPLLKRLMGLFANTPEEGAQTSIYLATSPEVEGVTGRYYYQMKPVESSPLSYDQTLGKQLWRVSEQLTGLAVVQ